MLEEALYFIFTAACGLSVMEWLSDRMKRLGNLWCARRYEGARKARIMSLSGQLDQSIHKSHWCLWTESSLSREKNVYRGHD